jgi:hypothetical protein
VTVHDTSCTNGVLRLGGSGYVSIGDRPSLEITNAITMAAWVCPSSIAGDRPILAKEGNSGRQAYWFGIYEGRFGLLLGDGSGWGIGARNAGPLTANEWCHLAVTWDGAEWRCYRNGVLAGAGSYSGTLPVSGAPLQLGQNSELASTSSPARWTACNFGTAR